MTAKKPGFPELPSGRIRAEPAGIAVQSPNPCGQQFYLYQSVTM
jgi:hypothetical protein